MEDFYLNSFRGGLVTNVSNDALANEEFPILENVDFDNRASLIRRLGYKNIVPTIESLERKYPFLSTSEIESRYNANVFNGRHQGYLRLIGRPYTSDDLYDFGNHSLPLFNARKFETRLSAVDGALYISDIKTTVDSFSYIGDVRPENNNPQFDEDNPALEPISFSEVFPDGFLRINALEKGTSFEALRYDITRNIKTSFAVIEFDMRIIKTLPANSSGIFFFFLGDNTFYSPIIFEGGIDAQIDNGNGRIINIGNDDGEFHTYKFEINCTNGDVKTFFDGLEVDFEKRAFYPAGESDTTQFNFGTKNFGQIQTDVIADWKNVNVTFTENTNPTQFESDLIYPIDGIHTITSFQDDEVIEAKQLENELIVATGTKLISVRGVINGDGTTKIVAQEMDTFPYVPTTKEFLFGGANILAVDPFNDIQDRQGATTSFSVDLFRTSKPIGVVDTDITIKAFVTLATGKVISDYEFKWEFKKSEDDTFSELQATLGGDAGRQTLFNVDTATNYDIRVTMNEIGQPTPTSQKQISNYKVTEIDENLNLDKTVDELNACTKIETYYGKIVLYKNGTTNIYKSFSGKFNWFATSGVIPFNNIRQEALQKVIPLRNTILGFTDNSTIGLRGKGDDIAYPGRPFEPFSEFVTFNANIGCIAPESVAITNDDKAVFLSNRGLHYVDTLAVDAGRADVIKIDDKINNIVFRDKDASGIVYDNKYYLSYPRKNKIIKWHYVYNGIFSLDTSKEVGFYAMYVYDDEMFGISNRAKIMQQQVVPLIDTLNDVVEISDIGLFIDDSFVYEMKVETKLFSFDLEQYLKRVFEFIIGFSSVSDKQIELFLDVFADNYKIIDSNTSFGEIQEIDGERTSVWVDEETPFVTGDSPTTLGDWLLAIASLGNVQETFRFFEIMNSPEVFKTKAIIRNKQDAFVRITSLGFIYQVGYIPREINGRINN